MADELVPSAPDTAPENEAQAPADGIRAFDQYGRQIVVPREQWTAEVLPGMLKEAWDQPDQLYGLILNSLNDGFINEVSEATEHLYSIDTVPARGACMWSIVLMQANRLDEAQQILENYGTEHGAEASVLLNLAKVYASQGDQPRADATLWQSLETEPNLDNAVGWYASLAAEAAATTGGQEAGQAAGEAAGKAALERIAAMPTSWRAQLWLARGELGQGNLGLAKRLYTEALARAPKPVPPEFLMQMSGDLGGGGFLRELIEFTAPEFIPAVHGMPVGNNLIKAFVDTGNLTDATTVKDALFALNRPDWKDSLNFWDAEINRRSMSAGNVAQPTQALNQQQGEQQIQIGMLRVDGPVWLPAQSPARGLFGAKAPSAPSVTFLGGTAEVPDAPAGLQGNDVQMQMSDAIGRMSRALPLFFAEVAEMRTAAQGRAMLPWAVGSAEAGRPSGFVVSGSRWPDEAAVQMVSDPANLTDYVVSVHLDAEVEPWTAELAFIRTSDGTRIGELQAEFPPADPAAGLNGLASEVAELLSALGTTTPPPSYQVPGGPAFGFYLLRLEQLLAVRCTTMQGAAPMSLSGERAILDGELDLCLAEPANLPARLLLIETLGVLTQSRPAVAEQFRDNFQRLIVEHPIPTLDAVFSQPTT